MRSMGAKLAASIVLKHQEQQHKQDRLNRQHSQQPGQPAQTARERRPTQASLSLTPRPMRLGLGAAVSGAEEQQKTESATDQLKQRLASKIRKAQSKRAEQEHEEQDELQADSDHGVPLASLICPPG